MFSTVASRNNPAALHGQTVGGPLYIFLEPPRSVSQVRWYLDALDKVYTTETAAPWELLGGRPWDTVATRVSDGQHRVLASITFTDDTTGFVDAIFSVRNGNQVAARALNQAATPFLEDNSTSSVTAQAESQVLPWSLFGGTCGVVIALVVVLIVINNKKSAVERV